jgi:hypothetical protein
VSNERKRKESVKILRRSYIFAVVGNLPERNAAFGGQRNPIF